MSVEFKLYCNDEELYKNKTKEEREKIVKEMVVYALENGIKPAARKYNTCPKTVRKWVNKFNTLGDDGLKVQK